MKWLLRKLVWEFNLSLLVPHSSITFLFIYFCIKIFYVAKNTWTAVHLVLVLMVRKSHVTYVPRDQLFPHVAMKQLITWYRQLYHVINIQTARCAGIHAGAFQVIHFTVKFLVDLTRSENETVRFLAPVHPIILISKNRFPGIDFRLQILNSFRTQIVGKLFDTHYKSWPRLWLIVQTERSVYTHENSRENPGACRVCGRKFSKLLASNWKIYCLLWRLNSWHWILWNHYGYYFHVTSNLFFYIGMRGNLHVGQTSHHLNVKSFSEAWNYLQIARNLKIVIWQM